MSTYNWYSNAPVGLLSDGSNWFLQNGTSGPTPTAPGAADTAILYDYDYLPSSPGYYITLTGSLGVADLKLDPNKNGVGQSNFKLAGTITAAAMDDEGSLVVTGSLSMTNSMNGLDLYGGTLDIDQGTLVVYGVYEGTTSGGSFSAVNGAHVTFLGGPNSITNGGPIGLTVKQTALVDHATVNSSAGLISIGDNDPTAPTSTMTVQDGGNVKALYTFIGSGATAVGSLVVTGAGTTYSDVGAASTTYLDSGFMVVGAYSSIDVLTSTGLTGTLTVSNGATLSESLGAYIGADAFAVGAATVATGAKWTVTTVLRVGLHGTGTLTVDAGSTVQSLGPHILGSSSIGFGQDIGSVGTGTILGAGALLNTGGDRLSIGYDGVGTVTVTGGGEIESGADYTDTEAALVLGATAGASGSLTVTGSGSLAAIAGLAVVGGTNIGQGNVAGGTGALAVTSSGRLNATSLALFSGGTIGVDTTGIIDIDGTSGAAGALTIEASGSLTAQGGTIDGTVADDGTLSNGTGTLALTGVLSGTGKVLVASKVSVATTPGGLTYDFTGSHATLAFSAEGGGSALVGFSQGDTIDFVGQNVTPTVANGILTAGGARFGLYGTPAGTHYVTASDGHGGTQITAYSAADDFNGDGKSDLLLQNAGGAIVIETQSNLAITGGFNVGNPGASWHVVGTGDFNGDGETDILVQNTNGQIVDYLMNGKAVAGGYYLGNPGAGWHVRGTGDFNGDGKSDILLQNDNGQMVVWYTNGTAITGAAAIANPGAGWTVEAVADFNGDGQTDILVQNTNGTLVTYTLNGAAVASEASLGNPGQGWAVAGTGDYTGTGSAAIVLHNDNGANVIWDTNGTAVTGTASLGNPGATWTGAVAGLDLNADGNPDLVVQNTSSTLVGYTLSDTAAITAGAVLGTPGNGWNAIGNNPVQFIDGTGATPNLTATPGADQFDLTSYTGGLHTIAGFDPAQDSVALSKTEFPTYAALQAAEYPYQGGTYVQLASGSALVIQGVPQNALTSSNFVLR